MNRSFTGWHMLGVMLAMFGTIITANFVMARSAITTFGGTVVDNSYVATAKYNDWLDKARVQKLLGDAISATVVYHRFHSDRLDIAYGREWDAMVSAKRGRWTATAKHADYRATSLGGDARKFWLVLEWAR